MLDSINPAAHIETRSCATCSAGFDVDLDCRGRRPIYCSRDCARRAERARQSLKTQNERRASAAPGCETCGGLLQVPIRGPVPRFCSRECGEISRGQRRPVPLDAIECALPGCRVTFVPFHAHQRCCSEQHGKNLYNRESRADGRQAPQPWNDRRRDAYHRRRALKKGASTGEPVVLSVIAERDRHKCGICGKKVPDVAWPHPMSASLDHIIPLSQGGSHAPSNVQLAHLRCNTAKGNRGGNEQLLLIG